MPERLLIGERFISLGNIYDIPIYATTSQFSNNKLELESRSRTPTSIITLVFKVKFFI